MTYLQGDLCLHKLTNEEAAKLSGTVAKAPQRGSIRLLEPDGSRRRFFIGAVRNPKTRNPSKTIHEAVALSYGIEPAVYSEAVRT